MKTTALIIILIFCANATLFGQSQELFYLDGGALGRIEHKDGFIYFYDGQVGLKRVEIEDASSNELVVDGSTIDISSNNHIYISATNDDVFIGGFEYLHKADLSDELPTTPSERLYTFWTEDIEFYDGSFYVSITDIGAPFYFEVELEPFTFDVIEQLYISTDSPGVFEIKDGIAYFPRSSTYEGDYEPNSSIFKQNIYEDSSTREILALDIGIVDDIQVSGNYLYTSDKVNKRILRFKITDDIPWTPQLVADLSGTSIEIGGITIVDQVVYFTDSNVGAIYKLDAALLAIGGEVGPLQSTLFPNPTYRFLTVHVDQQSEIKIYSLDGRLVKALLVEGGSQSIDLIDVETGIFIIQVIANGVNYKELIIKRD